MINNASVGLALAAVLLSSSIIMRGESIAGVVEKEGMNSKVAFEHVISGHLAELNGKYKLRVTETVYAPGGHIGPHHHAGPGIRLVLSGELTYIQGEKTTIYRTGDYIYESGDISHTAYNRTNEPVRILNFEILPFEWSGTSPMPVPNQSSDPTFSSGTSPAGQKPRHP